MTLALPVPDQNDIARLLGLENPRLVVAVRKGLPFTSYERLRAVLGMSARALAALLSIPERTLARRQQAGRLTSEESDRLLRLARLVELALNVFEGDAARAVRWLSSPKSLLGGESPLEHADTEPGAREVEDMLYTIEFTMPA